MYDVQYRNRLLPCLKALVVIALGIMSAQLAFADKKPKPHVFTVAVLGDAVYIGQAFPIKRRGKFHLTGYLKSDGECSGTFKYREYPRGRAKFECTNGLSGSIKLLAKGPLSGKGSALVDGRQVDFVYGYDLDKTNQLLDFPGGRQLAVENDVVVLNDPE